MDKAVAPRFWKNVKISADAECWEWQAGKTSSYGEFHVGGKMIYAHRMAYILYYGSIPDGLQVRHKCDNPPCCNPSHLLLGTNTDNIQDKIDRGRTTKGLRLGNVKLNPLQVRDIRQKYQSGNFTIQRLAEENGVNHATVSDILHGRTWVDV